MADEWRVEAELGDEGQHLTFAERLGSMDLDDKARERLGTRVIVTRDGPHLFMYAGSEEQAKEAKKVVRELLASEGIDADVKLTRWHPVEEAWIDASVPMPETEQEVQAEEQRQEAAEEIEVEHGGEYDWELRIDLPSARDTGPLARKLKEEGLDVHRRWRYLLVGAASEEQAAEIGERVRSEAPEGTELHVGPGGVPHPVWVMMGSRTPGIGRDLGL
jgi:hypothetical protein